MRIRKLLMLAVCLSFIFSVFAQKNMSLRSVLPYERALSNIWGYAEGGKEYALVGWYHGVSIVDVTNPDEISELFRLPGPPSNWREIKTWNHHLYATNETGDGLLIADLSLLPDSINYSYWTADTLFNTAHTLFIDENGFIYLFGYNDLAKSVIGGQRGALICDLNTDPKNPVIVGRYSEKYVHDGFVRGDTLWAAEIQDQGFSVIDVSDKETPVVLANQETPSRFAHNCWLSDDGKYLFTTDERAGAFIASYDVSDLGNISELDRYQAAPGSLLIPHNTHFLNNFLISSYYKYGANIVDATLPDNMVETGFYDTSPYTNSDGFNGCWGVYPYLPSGTILASDIETGLFVITPEYKRACYLEGNITYEESGAPANDVTVEIMTTSSIKRSDISGNYKTGIADPGMYDVRFYKDGCLPKIITGVTLERAAIETLNVTLTCTTFVNGAENEINETLRIAAMPSIFSYQTTLRYKIPAGSKNAELQVFDYHGKVLNAIPVSYGQGEIVVGNNFPQGIYLVRIISDSYHG